MTRLEREAAERLERSLAASRVLTPRPVNVAPVPRAQPVRKHQGPLPSDSPLASEVERERFLASIRPWDPADFAPPRELTSEKARPVGAAETHPAPHLWRNLRVGMTTAEVSALLGKPRWTEAFQMSDTLFWMYVRQGISTSGTVTFEGGKVSGWSTPES